MTAGSPLRSSLAPLAGFAAGAVVIAALVGRSTPEPRTAEQAATQVRQVQDASPLSEPHAGAPAAPAIAVPAVAPGSPPAPAPAPAVDTSKPDTGALVEEVQQLRDELARMKQELGQARADSQTAVLLDVDRHVAGIREQLAQNQAEREENSEIVRRAAAQRHKAVLMLFAAQQRLMIGDSDVLDRLDAAAPAMPYPAQTALQNARNRIESEDLYTARYWIGVAIVESGWSQLNE